MNTITRAISIRQPYVELILQGKKLKEFRSRRTHYRGRVYLYASITPKDDPSSWRRSGKASGSLPTGKIVGSVEIVDCRQTADGGYEYVLADPRRLRSHLVPLNQPQPSFWIPQF
jgi:ASCH domain